MKESIGYTVTLNIVIIFIIIVFAFLSAALIYFKSNKVSNVITETIEKYEGYSYDDNDNAYKEINNKLSSLGYNRKSVTCSDYYARIDDELINNDFNDGHCYASITDGVDGYCVFLCREPDEDSEWYYYYKISTNLMFNVPIINEILDIPIFSNTNRLYDFGCQKADENNC